MDPDLKKSIVKSTVITSFGQIISVLLLFIGSILIARFLPERELGTFFLLMTVWMFLQMLANFGLEATLIKYISSTQQNKKEEIFITLLTIRTISLITVSILYYLASRFFVIINPAINQYTIFIIIIFTLDSLRNFFNAELQGSKEFRSFIFVQVTQSTSKIILYIIGAIGGYLGVAYLLYVEIISIIISFIIQQYLTSITFRITYKIKFNEIKNIITFAFPLYLNNLLAVFSNRTNSIIIATFSNVINVAYYEVGKKIPDGLNRLSNSLTMVYYPYISQLLGEGKIENAKALLEKYIFSISLLGAPIILSVFFLRNEIMQVFFSSKYITSSLALSVFTLSFYFSLISGIIGYTFVAANKPALSFKINFFRTILSLSMSIILIPIWGFMGAVYSILLSSIVGWIVSFLSLKRISIQLSILKHLSPFLLSLPFILFSIMEIFLKFRLLIVFFLIIIYLTLEFLLFKDLRVLFNYLFNKVKIKFNK